MANTCYTDYAFFGDERAMEDFYDRLRGSMKPEDRDGLPLSRVRNAFRIPPEKAAVNRATIDYVRKDADCVRLSAESAWTPATDIFDEIIKSWYTDRLGRPILSYVYAAEEPGFDIFINTDRDGRYLSHRYLVDDGDNLCEYFDTEEDALTFLRSRFGINGKTARELRQSYEDKYDRILNIHVFEES